MRFSELERILRENGCIIYREGANHTIWQNPITGKKFPVPRHKQKEVTDGTLRSILRDAGIR